MRTSLVIASLALLTHASLASTPRVIDHDGPAEGTRPLDLRERWRVGGDDGDVIFGRIVDIARHADGCVYVLDNQLCQVVAISPAGEHLQDLSRQGDGPGELRQPTALMMMPDDILGIGMGYPGKMVTMRRDGTPVGTCYPVGSPAEGNIGLLMGAQFRDGVLVACGGRMAFEGQGEPHVARFLAVSGPDASDTRRVLQRSTPIDPTGQVYVEADSDYIDGRWCLGPVGHIFAAMHRDRYEVSEFDANGDLVRVFGRQEAPRRRTGAEKKEVRPLIDVGPEGERRWTIADHDPSVSRILYDGDEDLIWVLTPRGRHDQPDGVLQTWDVFHRDGTYLRRVPIPLGDEMKEGTCYLVGGRRLVVARGTGTSYASDRPVDDQDVEVLEVICYEMR